jgi:hypothetical protein
MFWKVTVKRLPGRERDIAKSTQVVLTGQNINDALAKILMMPTIIDKVLWYK